MGVCDIKNSLLDFCVRKGSSFVFPQPTEEPRAAPVAEADESYEQILETMTDASKIEQLRPNDAPPPPADITTQTDEGKVAAGGASGRRPRRAKTVGSSLMSSKESMQRLMRIIARTCDEPAVPAAASTNDRSNKASNASGATNATTNNKAVPPGFEDFVDDGFGSTTARGFARLSPPGPLDLMPKLLKSITLPRSLRDLLLGILANEPDYASMVSPMLEYIRGKMT